MRLSHVLGALIALSIIVLFAPVSTSPLVFAEGVTTVGTPPLWLIVLVTVLVVAGLVGQAVFRPHQDDRYGRPGGHRPDDNTLTSLQAFGLGRGLISFALAPIKALRRW